MNRLEKGRIYTIWLYLLAGGFFMGLLLMNVGSGFLLTENGIFNDASMDRLKDARVDGGSLLGYVLKQRLGGYLLLLLLSTTAIGGLCVYAAVLRQGLLIGMMIAAAYIRYGIKGFLLLLGSMFPHQFLLVPAGVLFLMWCLENHARLHGKGKNMVWHGRNRGRGRLGQIVELLWLLFVCFAGCILESYVNPILLCDMAKIF